jgi:hypothetical protein
LELIYLNSENTVNPEKVRSRKFQVNNILLYIRYIEVKYILFQRHTCLKYKPVWNKKVRPLGIPSQAGLNCLDGGASK